MTSVTATPQNDLTNTLIERLRREGFWGNLVLRFQRGEVVHITQEQSIQIKTTEPDTRRNNDQRTNR